MSETDTNEQEIVQPTPYRNIYRKDIAKDDDAESLDLSEVEEANKDTSALVQKQEQEHDWKKRYSDLKRHYDTKHNEWRQEKELLDAKMSAQQRMPAQLPKTPEELEAFRTEYPDIFDVMQSVSTLEARNHAQQLEKKIESLRENELVAKERVAEQELLVRHSDFFDIKEDPKFLEWLQLQPPNISDGLYNNKTDVDWAARVIDLYKLETGHSTQKAKPRKQDAASMITKTKVTKAGTQPDKKIWTSDEIAKLKPHEFEQLEREIDAANREGRII